MNKLVKLPTIDRAAGAASGRLRPAREATQYFAFLSYSHEDSEDAEWLHQELERFRVPSSLVGKLTPNGVIPKRLAPIFRDQHELAASHDLNDEIRTALEASKLLIVLCSPAAAKSKWTNAEIDIFKRVHPEGCIIAAVVAGEPLASDIPGREEEECFPPALVAKYNRRGKPTGKKTEPLAADLRESKEGRRTGFLKIVAGMLGVGLDDLVQREATRRQRRLAFLTAASLAGMAVTSTLAVTAIQARDAAREQRRQAEGLVAFMLGDLKDKLEPIGRLDALDGVGARVLAYYKNEGTSDLSDAALSQRSDALSLMGEVAMARGDNKGALRLYREAMAGTGEAVQRNPNDPERVFKHAQNVFYVGEISHNEGDFTTAERFLREYNRLALRMVALQPDSLKYRMEVQYSEFNLGVALSDQRRFAEAAAQFNNALQTIQAIAAADPHNTEYRQQLAESLAWLGDAESAIGDYTPAIDSRLRGIAILQQLFDSTGDVSDENRLVQARRTLAIYYGEQGRTDEALTQLRAAVAEAADLIPKEPANSQWQQYAYMAKLTFARQLLLGGKRDEAAAQTEQACTAIGNLLKRHPDNAQWRAGFTSCLAMRARVALSAGAARPALEAAQAAADVSNSVHSGDATKDAYLSAAAYQILGDVKRQSGDAAGAMAAWKIGLSRVPANAVEVPSELAERAGLLQRLGRTAEAQPLVARLNSIGYRQPL